MKKIFRTKVWPVLAGLIAASVVMMAFEYANSFFYPLPLGLDTSNVEMLRAFTATLPWTAYILVFLGWVAGSFIAGYLTTWLSKEWKYKLSLLVGVILTLLGIANNLMIGHDLLFNIIGLPMFLIFTYVGHRYAVQKR